MERIPPISPRSRWEPPLSPAQLEQLERERREQARERTRRPRPAGHTGEQRPGGEPDDGSHVETRA